MGIRRNSSNRGGLTASVAAVALVLGGIPTASLALDALGKSKLDLAAGSLPFTPASVDPQLAAFVAGRAADAHSMRFTPAGVAEQGKRSMTVAVRVDGETAHAIQVRSAIDAAQDQMAGSAVHILPARYSLGLARGFESFAQPSVLSKSLTDAAIPDLSSFSAAAAPLPPEQSRFASHVALAHEEKTGVAPRTREALGEQSVDLATSYRLTRNLDVSAGVRYSQARDRIAPAADPTSQDSQAVYIGTQFRF